MVILQTCVLANQHVARVLQQICCTLQLNKQSWMVRWKWSISFLIVSGDMNPLLISLFWCHRIRTGICACWKKEQNSTGSVQKDGISGMYYHYCCAFGSCTSVSDFWTQKGLMNPQIVDATLPSFQMIERATPQLEEKQLYLLCLEI